MAFNYLPKAVREFASPIAYGIGANKMKRLLLTILSTAAVCAVLSATPVAAQETITGAPPGQAPVTAVPSGGGSNNSGSNNNSGPLGVVGAILGAPFEVIGTTANATAGGSAGATQSDARCHVTRELSWLPGPLHVGLRSLIDRQVP